MRLDALLAAVEAGTHPGLVEREKLDVVLQVADVLQQLHANGLDHGCLQLHACFLDAANRVVVLDNYVAAAAGALPLGPPALQRGVEADMWSLGALILALFASSSAMVDVLQRCDFGATDAVLPPDAPLDPVREIAQSCLSADPQRRPTAVHVASALRELQKQAPTQTPEGAPDLATNELAMHCRLLQVGSKTSKAYSALVMGELMLDHSMRGELRERHEDQAVVAVALAQAFQDTRDAGVDYMPIESQALLSRAALALLADERLPTFRETMTSQDAARLHAYFFVQSNVLRTEPYSAQAPVFVQQLAALACSPDKQLVSALAQHAALVEAFGREGSQVHSGDVSGLVALARLLSACATPLPPGVRVAVLGSQVHLRLRDFLNPASPPDVQAAGFLLWLNFDRLQLDPVQAVLSDAHVLPTIVDVAARSTEELQAGSLPTHTHLELEDILECLRLLRLSLPTPTGPSRLSGSLSSGTVAVLQGVLKSDGGQNLLTSLISSNSGAAVAAAVGFCDTLLSAITAYVRDNSSTLQERGSLLVQLGVSAVILQGLLAATLSQLPPASDDDSGGAPLVALVVNLVHCLPFVADALLRSVMNKLLETLRIVAAHVPRMVSPLMGSLLRLVQDATPFRAGTAPALPTRIADALIAHQLIGELLGRNARMDVQQLSMTFALLCALYAADASLVDGIEYDDGFVSQLVELAHQDAVVGASSPATNLLARMASRPGGMQKLQTYSAWPKAAHTLAALQQQPPTNHDGVDLKRWGLSSAAIHAGGPQPPLRALPPPGQLPAQFAGNHHADAAATPDGAFAPAYPVTTQAQPLLKGRPNDVHTDPRMTAIMQDLGFAEVYAPHTQPNSHAAAAHAAQLPNGASGDAGQYFGHADAMHAPVASQRPPAESSASPTPTLPAAMAGWGIAAPQAAYEQPTPMLSSAASTASAGTVPKKFNFSIVAPADAAAPDCGSTPSSISETVHGTAAQPPSDPEALVTFLEECVHDGPFVSYFINDPDVLPRIVEWLAGLLASGAAPGDAGVTASWKSAGAVLRRLAKRSLTPGPKSAAFSSGSLIVQQFSADAVLSFLMAVIVDEHALRDSRLDMLKVLSALTFGSQIVANRFAASSALTSKLQARGVLPALVKLLQSGDVELRAHALEPLRNISYFSTKACASLVALMTPELWRSVLATAASGSPADREKVCNLVFLLVSKVNLDDGPPTRPEFVGTVIAALIEADFAVVCPARLFFGADVKDDLLKKWANLMRTLCDLSADFAEHVITSGGAITTLMALWPMLSYASPRHMRDYVRDRRAFLVLPDERMQAVSELLASVVQAVITNTKPALVTRDGILQLCQGDLADKCKAAQLMALHGTSWSLFSEASRSKKADPHALVLSVTAALGAVLKDCREEAPLLAAMLCFHEWCVPGAEGGNLPPTVRQSAPAAAISRIVKSDDQPNVQYLGIWMVGILVYDEGSLQLRFTKDGLVDVLLARLSPRTKQTFDVVQACTLALGNMLFNNHPCIKNPGSMDEPMRSIVATLDQCPKPSQPQPGRPRLDCAKHICEALVNITYRNPKNCQKLRDANGINSLLRMIQGVVDDCNRSPVTYDPSRTGIDRALKVLKYLCLNDSKAGDAKRVLSSLPALRDVLDFFSRYGDEVGREARSLIGEMVC